MAILTIVSACTHIPSDINGDQVFFAFDSAQISDDARDNLESQALYMKKNPDINVTIQGRCDERGSTEYNLGL